MNIELTIPESDKRSDNANRCSGAGRLFHSGGEKMIARICLAMLAGACLSLGQTIDSAGRGFSGSAAQTRPESGIGLLQLIQPQSTWEKTGFTYRENLFLCLDEGEAEQGMYDHPIAPDTAGYTRLDHVWLQDMVFHLTEDVTYKERLRLIMSVEAELNFSMVHRLEYPSTLIPAFTFYPNDMELQYSVGGTVARPWFTVAAGYFPFKYNPDAKNLGEFLLRCGAYPTIIQTTPFFPMTRELGLHVSSSSDWFMNPAIDRVQLDLMLTSETHDWPVQDFTLTGILSNNLFNILDLGAGVSFQRLMSVNELLTTPHTGDSVSYLDQNAQTQYYTFASTKIMGRAAISPLRFVPQFKIPPSFIFGEHSFFGKQDLKVYGEIAVLGTQDYVKYWSFARVGSIDPNTGDSVYTNVPGTGTPLPDSLNFYNNIKDRMPMMLGIDLPTTPLLAYGVLPFILTKWLYDETGSDIRQLAWVTLVPALASGVAEHFLGWDMGLDELSLEFEWFSQKYTNSDRNQINPEDGGGHGGIPIPYTNDTWNAANLGKAEPTKYSLYFKKAFLDRFAVSGIVGRDHMRPASIGVPPSIQQTDDFLKTRQNWYWM